MNEQLFFHNILFLRLVHQNIAFLQPLKSECLHVQFDWVILTQVRVRHILLRAVLLVVVDIVLVLLSEAYRRAGIRKNSFAVELAFLPDRRDETQYSSARVNGVVKLLLLRRVLEIVKYVMQLLEINSVRNANWVVLVKDAKLWFVAVRQRKEAS